MKEKWTARWRRLLFALRWAWTGRAILPGPITFVCQHSQPGDVVVHCYRGVDVGAPLQMGWSTVGETTFRPLIGSAS